MTSPIPTQVPPFSSARRWLLLALLAACALTAAAAPTRWEQSAARKKELAKDVVWLSHEPLEFQLRRGGEHDAAETARYAAMVAPENFRRMAAAGVRYNEIYFYKGFGLDYERANFETVKQAAAQMHALSMKVNVYVGGTMFIETFYRETPEAINWERRDQNNRWVPYGNQTFRHYACTNEPAYRAYLKRVLRYAVEEVRADQVFFDNLMLQQEPQSCRCPRCLAAFKEFLRRRYPTPAAVRSRFGLPDVDAIWVNEWESAEQASALTELNDPVLQEWVRFRCESLAGYTVELADYVKQLNPAVRVSLNLKGVFSFNRYWTNAVYQPLYAGHCDALHFDTGGFEARLDARTGALVSQIRSYKMAREMKVNCLDMTGTDDLRTAVHLAFGYQQSSPTGWPGSPWDEGCNTAFTPLLEFFRAYNDRYFTDTETVADVAVLHTWPSLAYSIHAAYEPTTLVEQVLIQHQVPFDFLYEEQFGKIDRYAAVILAGQECVSQAQADALLRYVRQGGTLVLTDNTAEFNQWRKAWPVNPLLPARREGLGRIIHIPKVIPGLARAEGKTVNEDPEPGATLKPGVTMNPTQWVLPYNHAAIHAAIVGGLPQGPSLTTTAPLTTVIELLNRPGSHETMVHFVNFDQKRPTAPIEVSVRAQFPAAVKSVTVFSPDADDPVSVPFEVKDGRVHFTVPAVRLYTMVVVAHAS